MKARYMTQLLVKLFKSHVLFLFFFLQKWVNKREFCQVLLCSGPLWTMGEGFRQSTTKMRDVGKYKLKNALKVNEGGKYKVEG